MEGLDGANSKRIPEGAVRQIKTSCKDGGIKVKYEAHFKPRKEDGVFFNWIYLGRFDPSADAEVVYRMVASCYDYGKGYGTPLDLAGDGRELFAIIPEFTPAKKTLLGRAKRELVKERVQELYECYKTKMDAALNLPPSLPGADLEQELENRRLRLEVSSWQQQKEDLECQLQRYVPESSAILTAPSPRSASTAESPASTTVSGPKLIAPTTISLATTTFLTINEIWQGRLARSHFRRGGEFGAVIDALTDMEQFLAVPGLGAESTNSWGGRGDIHN